MKKIVFLIVSLLIGITTYIYLYVIKKQIDFSIGYLYGIITFFLFDLIALISDYKNRR